ncbi:MAG: tyrosine--tRNA ligase, partial [Bacteroides sp.]
RRAVEQGGITLDGEKITDITTTIPAEKFEGEGVVLKKGKKTFQKIFM